MGEDAVMADSTRSRQVDHLARAHGGVVHRRQLAALGVTREALRAEVRARRWELAGRHTVIVRAVPLSPVARWWRAVLDFGVWCRAFGLPPPDRQVLRTTGQGRAFLDCLWADIGLVAEIDGGHHAAALNPVDDALRQNDVAMSTGVVLRIPVVGLRVAPERFMLQVRPGLRPAQRPAPWGRLILGAARDCGCGSGGYHPHICTQIADVHPHLSGGPVPTAPRARRERRRRPWGG